MIDSEKIINPVSWCGTAFKNPEKVVDLVGWLTSQAHRAQVIMYRRGFLDKRELPCITPGGTFAPTKQISDFKKGSGILFVDIDSKDNDIHYCRETLRNSKYTLAMSSSSSGNGLSVFMKIPHKMNASTYRNYYVQMEEYLKQYGIVADPSGKNINRLRYASYDVHIYVNMDSEELPLWYKPKLTKKEVITVDSEFKKTIVQIIEAIERSGWDISKVYNDWIYLAGFFYNVFGDREGLAMFIRLSKYYPSFDAEEAIKKYEQCKTFANVRLNKFFRLIKPYESTGSKKSSRSTKAVCAVGSTGEPKRRDNGKRKSIQ